MLAVLCRNGLSTSSAPIAVQDPRQVLNLLAREYTAPKDLGLPVTRTSELAFWNRTIARTRCVVNGGAVMALSPPDQRHPNNNPTWGPPAVSLDTVVSEILSQPQVETTR